MSLYLLILGLIHGGIATTVYKLTLPTQRVKVGRIGLIFSAFSLFISYGVYPSSQSLKETILPTLGILIVLAAVSTPKQSLYGRENALTFIHLWLVALLWNSSEVLWSVSLLASCQLLAVLEEYWEGRRDSEDPYENRRTVLFIVNALLVSGSFCVYALFPMIGALGPLLLLVATCASLGIFPFHSWAVAHFARPRRRVVQPMLTIFIGIYILSVHFVPMVSTSTWLAGALRWISAPSLLYFALLLFGEKRLKRITAYLYLSSVSVLALMIGYGNVSEQPYIGLIETNILLATAGLLFVAMALSSRFGIEGVRSMTGLSDSYPLAGSCFLISTLSLVGFPGTYGFLTEEVILSSLATSPFILTFFVIAMALNGYSCFRIFGELFGGQRREHSKDLRMQVPERVSFAAIIVVLLSSGIGPALLSLF